jgi:hypothetical protein
MIKVSIDVTKIEKHRLFEGKPRQSDGGIPKYLSCALLENKDGPDKYGNDGFIVQDVSKSEKESGVKGVIIGNWRDLDTTPKPAPASVTSRVVNSESKLREDDIPF